MEGQVWVSPWMMFLNLPCSVNSSNPEHTTCSWKLHAPLVPLGWDSSLSFNFSGALGCKQHCSWGQNVTEDLLFMLANKVLKQCDVC